MKKTKLLLAAPLLLAPVMTTIPLMASCHKQADLSINGDIAQYANIRSVTKQLVVGEPYIIEISIKSDQIGKKFLPNTLSKVTSGGQEMFPLEDNPSNAPHYYIYSVAENNTVASLTIGRAQGPITFEAQTAELESISAYGIDLAAENCAEFEVGETLTNDTSRVLVEAHLSNDDSFFVEDSYTIALGSIKAGYTFVEGDKCTEKTGTVNYQGKTASFQYCIIDKTATYFYDIYNETITKYTDILTAINKYNEADDGEYIISVADGSYQFSGDTPIKITQKDGKYLTLRALNEPEFDGKFTKYPVSFVYKPTATAQSLIKIEGDSENTDSSSIDIRGIRFVYSKDVAAENYAYNYIWLDNSPSKKQVHDINIELCAFIGNEDKITKVNAIATPTSIANSIDPTLISIEYCLGYFLNNLFSGYAHHDGSTVTYSDLYIGDSVLISCNHLFDAKGSGMKALIYEVAAGLMYNASTTGSKEGVLIEAPGEYTFRYCSFQQLDEDTSDDSSFIHIKSNDTNGSHNINLYATDFTKMAGATKKIYAVSLETSDLTLQWDIYALYWIIEERGQLVGETKTWEEITE